MSPPPLRSSAALACASLLGAALASTPLQAQTPTEPAAAATPAIVDLTPRVPRPRGKPCVVRLVGDIASDGPAYGYTPPAVCPRPWAKVVVELDFSGSRHAHIERLWLNLGGVPVFNGATPDPEETVRWHAERDVTDLSALFGVAHRGRLDTSINANGDTDGSSLHGGARLVFYPPTARAPAPRVPDRVYAVNYNRPIQLPRNIVRAYLDVYNTAEWWFSCVPTATYWQYAALRSFFAPGGNEREGINPAEEGCEGDSFAEVRVLVDSAPAGLAPVFPLLPGQANPYFIDALGHPVAVPHMLGWKPYRIDLTPFAGVLNDAGPHHIDPTRSRTSVLLLYLDPHASRVGGAVTYNSLGAALTEPDITNTLAEVGDTLGGTLSTRASRTFRIEGYVDTSRGRIRSSVAQFSRFSDVQRFHLDGLSHYGYRYYGQSLELDSLTTRASRRTQGHRLLAADVETYRYPLTFDYAVTSRLVNGDQEPVYAVDRASLKVAQKEQFAGAYLRGDAPVYRERFSDEFRADTTRPASLPDGAWWSVREVRFQDNRGACFARTARGEGLAVKVTAGSGCPDGRNHVPWPARPDGSPVSLGWLQP